MTVQNSEDVVRVDTGLLEKQISSILHAWGVNLPQIEPTVQAMVYADTHGIDSHGISMLMLYEHMVSQGTLNLTATPQVIKESSSTALIDADAGLGHPVAKMAMALAIEKAQMNGICSVSVFNSHHFGAAGYYVKMASNARITAYSCQRDRRMGRSPLYPELMAFLLLKLFRSI